MLAKFLKRVEGHQAKIGIVGLGYVGLPLAVAFAKKGFSVTGIDISPEKIRKLNQGISYILDVRSQDLKEVIRLKRFKATNDYKSVSSLDAVILCVPTPLSKTKEPDISYVIEATKAVSNYLKKGHLVVLESTTYPGTTEEIMLPLLRKSRLNAEKDLFLAFSPERVDPGNKDFDIVSIPKVVGGIGPNSTKAATALYGSIMKKIVPVSSARTAEMVKLLENTFRSVNIGLINEIAVMSHRLGIDIWEVIEAAKTKPFGFMPFYPGPGIGGHCLPIDPLYLSWKSKLHGYEAKMIELASAINEYMPEYVVERISHLLNEHSKALKNAPVLVLGVSYKKNIDDLRESPAVEVIKELLRQGSKVSYSDPWVPNVHLEGISLKSKKLSKDLIRKQFCVVVLTDHAAFDYRMIAESSSLILDTRNALRSFAGKKNLFYL